MSATAVPERLGKYEVRGTLGKGAMGVVYSGWDPIISRKVAIKTVRLPDASEVEAQEELHRFKREAQAAGRLTHPNIVGVFDYGETDTLAYIVMEFVDGQTLKGLLDAGDRLAMPQVARVMGDLLAGLRYSHERGVVHRDIKPANIMITGEDGHGPGTGGGQAKIADFGIARIESSNLTQAGTIMGTPAYMSPEQFMGQTVDARTDIYSSGVLLFQLLTGDRPFEGSMATIMHKALNTVPPRPSELSVTAPRALDPVVARAMAKRPEERFQTAAEFAGAITTALAQPAVPVGLGQGLGDLDLDATVNEAPGPRSTAASARTIDAAPTKSRVPMLVAAGAIVLALAGGGVWFALPSASSSSSGSNAAPPPKTPVDTVVARIEPPVSPPPTDLPPPALPPPASALVQPPVEPSAAKPPEPPPAPEPRPTVTQVVPPTNAPPRDPAGTQAATVPTSKPAVIVPPSAPAGPPAPTVTEPAGSSAGSTRTEMLAGTRPQPALVPPPATGTSTSPSIAEPAKPPAPLATTSAPTTITPAPAPVYVPPHPEPTASVPSDPTVAPPVTPQTALPTTPPVQPPPVVASVAVLPEALRQAVAGAVRGVECAVVGGDVSRSSGLVTLRGVVGRGRPEQDLLRSVHDAAPTAAVDWAIGIADGPYCGALNLVRAYARPFGAASGGMDIGLKDNRTSLVEDQQVQIVTQAPDFPSYVEVDYFMNDGKVAHLRYSATGSPIVPSRLQQGFDGGPVGTPFGTDVIVAIGSATPLFAKERPQIEETEKYLRELRTALEAAKSRRSQIAAGAVMVQTSAKP